MPKANKHQGKAKSTATKAETAAERKERKYKEYAAKMGRQGDIERTHAIVAALEREEPRAALARGDLGGVDSVHQAKLELARQAHRRAVASAAGDATPEVVEWDPAVALTRAWARLRDWKIFKDPWNQGVPNRERRQLERIIGLLVDDRAVKGGAVPNRGEIENRVAHTTPVLNPYDPSDGSGAAEAACILVLAKSVWEYGPASVRPEVNTLLSKLNKGDVDSVAVRRSLYNLLYPTDRRSDSGSSDVGDAAFELTQEERDVLTGKSQRDDAPVIAKDGAPASWANYADSDEVDSVYSHLEARRAQRGPPVSVQATSAAVPASAADAGATLTPPAAPNGGARAPTTMEGLAETPLAGHEALGRRPLARDAIPPLPHALNDDTLVGRCHVHCLRRAAQCAMQRMVDLKSMTLLLVGPTRADLETLGEYWGTAWADTDAIACVAPASWATTLLPPTTVGRHSWLHQLDTDPDGAMTPVVVLGCCGIGSMTSLGYLKTNAAVIVSCELTATAKNKTWPANAKATQSYGVEEHNGLLTLTPLGCGGVVRVLRRPITQLSNQSVDIDGAPFANELITTYYVVPEHKAADAVRSPIEAVFHLTRCAAPVQAAPIVIPNADVELVDAAHHMALAGLAGNGDVKRYMQNTVQAMLRTQGTITPAGWHAHIDKAADILNTVSQSVSTVCGMASFHHALAENNATTLELVGQAVMGTWSNATRATARHLIGRAATDWRWFGVACSVMLLYLMLPVAVGFAIAAGRAAWAYGALGTAWASVHTGAAAVLAAAACAGWQHHGRAWLWLLLIATSYGALAQTNITAGNVNLRPPAPAAPATCVYPWLSDQANGVFVDDFEALVASRADLCQAMFPAKVWGNYSAGPVVSTRRAVNRCYRALANEDGDVDYTNATVFASACRACGACWYTTPPDCWRPGPHRLHTRAPPTDASAVAHCARTDGPCSFCPFDVPATNNTAIRAIAVSTLTVHSLVRTMYYETNRAILHYQRVGNHYFELVVNYGRAVARTLATNLLQWLNGTTLLNVTVAGHRFTWTGDDAIAAGSYVVGRIAASGARNEQPPMYLLAAALVGAIVVTRASVQGSTSVRKGRIDPSEATWKHMVLRPPGLYDLGRDVRGLATTPLLCLGLPECFAATGGATVPTGAVGPEHRLRIPAHGIQAHCPTRGAAPVLCGLASAASFAVARCPHNAVNAVVNRHCVARPPPHTPLSHRDRSRCDDCLRTVDLTGHVERAGVHVDHFARGKITCSSEPGDGIPEDMPGRCLSCSARFVPYPRACETWLADRDRLSRMLMEELVGADEAWAARFTAASLERLVEEALVLHVVAWLVKAFTKTEVNVYPPSKARLIQGYGQPAAQLVHAVLTFAIQHVAACYHNDSGARGYASVVDNSGTFDRMYFGCGMRPDALAALPDHMTSAVATEVACPRACDCYCHVDEVAPEHVDCRCEEPSLHWVEADCSNYDAHNSAMHFWASWTFYYACLELFEHELRRTYLQFVVDSFAVTTNYVLDETRFAVDVYGTTKSGHNDTSLGNTLRGIAMWLEAFDAERAHRGSAEWQTPARYCGVVAGDDSLVVQHCSWEPSHAAHLSKHGMKVKEAVWDNHYDASFLSSVWAFTPAGDVFISKPGRLLAKLFWAHPFQGSGDNAARRHASAVAIGVQASARLVPGIREFVQRVYDLGVAGDPTPSWLRWSPMIHAWDPARYSDHACQAWVHHRYGVSQAEIEEFQRILLTAKFGELVACEFTRKVMMRDLPDAAEVEGAVDDVLLTPDVALSPLQPY